jgi:uncharacterized protein (TIGR03435 family)
MERAAIPLERRMKGAPGPSGIGHGVRSWDARRSQAHTLEGVCSRNAADCRHERNGIRVAGSLDAQTEENNGMRRIVAAFVMMSAVVAAQDQAPVLDASFEAASFRRNVGGGNVVWQPRPTGQFTIVNIPFETLILGAYQLQPYQLQGAPSWVRDERYDITARLDPQIAGRLQPDGHPPTWALALRNLLTERARLAFHRETRQLPIYALVMARRDGRLGPNIRPAQADCDALRLQSVDTARSGQPSPYPAATPTWMPCGLRNAPGRLVSGGFGFAEFLAALSAQLGRPVLDRTGLTGKWDFFVSYAPNSLTAAATPDTNAPDLFTALEEQLGLKLESTQGPADVFVIDRLERPAE